MRAFPAGNPPLDLRKPVPVWQATLADGAHIYINRDSGEIEAVRTRWWRIYDFVWGIHIMDLQTREDAHNPFTIAFGSLSLLGALLGLVLLFRRRKARGARMTPASLAARFSTSPGPRCSRSPARCSPRGCGRRS